jgi:carbon monoxide dehydrogenase subunit G
MRVSRAVSLEATQEDVWRVLSDPHRLPAWWPGVERVEEVSEQAWTKVLRSPRGGKAVRADFSLADADPPSRVTWRQEVEESPFERIMSEAVYRFDLKPEGERTRFSASARVKLRGFSRLGYIQVRRATARRLDEALAGLAELVE